MPADFVAHYRLNKAPSVELLCCNYALLTKWDFADVVAPYWHWYWVNRSGASITCNGKRINLEPGKIILIPPNLHFSADYQADPGEVFGQLYIVFLLKNEFKQDPPSPIVIPLSKVHAQLIEQFCQQIMENQATEVSPLLMPPAALVSLALSQTDRACWIQPNRDLRVTRAIKKMESDYPAAVSNETLSRLAGMNTNSFIRLFKAVTNETPRQYLLGLRLSEAASLLRHSTMSVEAIAEQTGFNDRVHFNLMFRKKFEMTPVQFRKNSPNA